MANSTGSVKYVLCTLRCLPRLPWMGSTGWPSFRAFTTVRWPGMIQKNTLALIERSEEHTSELQSPCNVVCRLLLEKKTKSPPPCTNTSTETQLRIRHLTPTPSPTTAHPPHSTH